jgi:hypothetical protein
VQRLRQLNGIPFGAHINLVSSSKPDVTVVVTSLAYTSECFDYRTENSC